MERICRILVPVVGERLTDEVMDLACQTARKNKAELFLLYIIEVQRQLALETPQTDEMAKGELTLDQVAQRVEHYGCRPHLEMLQARSAGAAIIGEAINRKADLIILGMSLRNRYGEQDIADKDLYVLKNAPCRVWVVREQLANGNGNCSEGGPAKKV